MSATKADVMVIGGGVVGVACAYYAACSGASVILLEKSGIAAGASYGNAGLLVPSHCEPLSSPGIVTKGLRELINPEGAFYLHPRADFGLARWLLAFRRHCTESHYARALEIHTRLNRESLACHQQLGKKGGTQYGFKLQGLLSPFATEEAFLEAQQYAERVRPLGIQFKILTPSEVRQLEDSIQGPIVGATLSTADGWLKPDAFVHWLAEEARAAGARIATGTEVFGFDTSRRRVTTAITTRGRFQAAQVVVAAGSWSPLLTRWLHTRLPIEGAKGYSITFKQPQTVPKLPLMLEEERIAVTPFGDSVRFAGTLELAGLDLSLSRRRVEAIDRNGKNRLARTSDWELEEIWSGLRPCTPDGLPVLGRLRDFDNLYVAGGHATKGISQGPGTGKLLADLMSGKSIGALEHELSPQRFRNW